MNLEFPSKSAPRVSIKEIVFSDGTVVDASENDIFVIVGPNNAGKSGALRAVREKLENPIHTSQIIRQITVNRTGSSSEFLDWIKNWALVLNHFGPENPIFQALGHGMAKRDIESVWPNANNSLGGISRWFCHLLTTEERLQICNPPTNISLLHDNPVHPIHFLQRNDELELILSARFRKAFGVDLIVHRNAGGMVPLYVGARPVPAENEDRVSIGYIAKLEQLPTLHTQGDGMRSFAGVLLATSIGRETIVLIDEPEAFLHPPQARLLGTTMVQDRLEGRQLFIATHSSDVVRGILDTGSKNVRVIRIKRHGNTNSVRLLDNDRIKELWGDPLLRHSNILDGLFHEAVVVCEGDADCRFYSAIMDSIIIANNAERRQDIVFTHCGGKARLPVVIHALREVDVPVCAIADFDILADESTLSRVVTALGMNWDALRADWETVKFGIDSKKPELKSDEIKAEIIKILDGIKGNQFSTKAKNDIQAILRRSSPWAQAKSVGEAFIPAGDASKAAKRLLAELRKGGLHIVEVGELEGFVKTEAGHGPKWVNAVLARTLDTDPELEAARKFVQRLIKADSD
ncbi:putative AbiEii toxin of type IV toxin-antitoxin system [Nitrosospira sp. Nsp2]|uniref:AAA family ATPase n=1 Tax=Nitrosospira sp. Nsp2 TaxID=136548 RepID=UPI000D31E255|nr:AAA family ATPase [Nitrosospira sp. Nsp2]PTR17401.1 putative AbiEii toxin of type IV toxin-antitoxin system [Nitrosospira sp. Nsp2]